MISIVSPVYRAEKILETLVSEIEKTMSKIREEYEIILVDDRSPDNSWQKMLELKKRSKNLKIFRLSKNFGQHPAIFAGISQAKGDWIVVMDCDMQDKPEEIINLYNKAKEGYDIVLAKRKNRQHGFFKVAFSKMYYKTFKYLADIEVNNEIGNFGIYNKKVINAALSLNDNIKFFPLFINWIGFNRTTIDVEHDTRLEGKSTYSFGKLLSLAFNTIVSFSEKPLKIFVYFGGIVSVIAFLTGLYFLYKAIIGEITEPGFSSLIISIWFFSGLIISIIGIVGIYIGKAFNQTKNRPVFIIDEKYGD